MTRILLYSDEPILAKGLESVLRQVEGFELLPTCGTVASLLENLAQMGIVALDKETIPLWVRWPVAGVMPRLD